MGRPILYSDEENAFLRARATMPRRELRDKFAEAFNRPEISYEQIKSKCTRMGLKTGRTGCFAAGRAPANKGRRGVSYPGMERTQFKKGGVSHNAKPIGYERICSKNGYILMKVARPNPYTGAKTRIMPKHRYLWEEDNGPIPSGHCLRAIDGDPANWRVENWFLVPFSLNARLNVAGYNTAPAELRPAILAMCKLNDRIGEIEPSYAQSYNRRPTTKKPSKKTAPAKHLFELLVEDAFSYDCAAYAGDIDAAIAAAYPDKAWSLDLSSVLPSEPKILHIDWRRAKKRPDIRNKILEFFPNGLPDKIRSVR